MASTKDILDRHLEFFGEGDLKGILLIMRREPSCSRRTDPSGELTRLGRSSRR
jgi:hypothetical protein